MDKRLTEALFAVFTCILVGLFIGWLTEVYLNWHWLPAWSLSVCVSGLAVYLLCDIPGLKVAIPKALRYAVTRSPWSRSTNIRRRWGIFFQEAPRLMEIVKTLSLWLIGILWLTGQYDTSQYGADIVHAHIVLTMCFIALGSLFSLAMAAETAVQKPSREIRKNIEANKDLYKCFREANPFRVLFCWLPYGLYWVVTHVPAAIRVCGHALAFTSRFLWKFYALIHSSIRAIALIDTAIFVGTFYFTYSPFGSVIAASAGAIWFRIHYLYIAPRVAAHYPA